MSYPKFPRVALSFTLVSLMASTVLAEQNSCQSFYTGIKAYTQKDMDRLRKKYQGLEQKLYWKSFVEDVSDVSQLIHTRFQQENIANGAPIKNFELFGLENYKVFVAAREFLNRIPEGSFVISPELIKEVHERSASGLQKELPLWKRALGKDAFVEAGVYKKRNNRGEDPLLNPLTEEQYQVLIANPFTKFRELPWPLSRENARRGWILYGNKDSVERDVQELSVWVNKQMALVKVGKADPVRVAAEFQWRYVSIHPMVDGNGRTSMLLANRILEEADLPPIMMTMSGYDIYYKPEVWAEKIRQSIFDFETLINDAQFKEYIDKETPNLYKANFSDGPRLGLTPETFANAGARSELNKLNSAISKRWPTIKRELFAENESQEVNLGNQRFVAMMDGFFYNKHGVPHVLHKDSSGTYKLYPMAEEALSLYSLGGKTAQTGEADQSKRFFKRGMSVPMRDNFRTFFGFMKQYTNRTFDTASIEVLDYSMIAKANKEGLLFLYDWQKPMLQGLMKITDTDPIKVLAPTRGYQTNYEKSVHFGYKTNLHEILAQYQLMDLKYSNVAEYAQANGLHAELAEITASRKKLFDAAKSLLADRAVELEQALIAYPEKFPSSQEWNFFLAYYKASPLKYSSFEEYNSSKDKDYVVLLRADQGMSKRIGFISNTLFREIVDKVPGEQAFKAHLNKLVTALGKASKTPDDEAFIKLSPVYNLVKVKYKDANRMLRNLNNVLQMSKYDTRSMAAEFDRIFVEHALHAVNDPFKTSISFSTNTSIYIRSKKVEAPAEAKADGETTIAAETTEAAKDIIPFTFDADDAQVYFVKLKKSDVDANEASKYFRQYEVLKPKVASPFAIIKSFGNDFFALDGAGPTTKQELKDRTTFEEQFVALELALAKPAKKKK
ncbi:MAG: hypothetical protein B7Y39_07905 [Bdellovibrio sp. 28-41-41]|nr:MAG: hypothetical protein B7Y39_07905 [Bdellovibrio sp. 28-41-41]